MTALLIIVPIIAVRLGSFAIYRNTSAGLLVPLPPCQRWPSVNHSGSREDLEHTTRTGFSWRTFSRSIGSIR